MTDYEKLNRLEDALFKIRSVHDNLFSMKESLRQKMEDEQKFWTDEDVEEAKAVKKVLPNAYEVQVEDGWRKITDSDGKLLMTTKGRLIKSLTELEAVRLDDIIGGAE